MDTYEAELEQLNKKKKSGTDRKGILQAWVERHKFHIQKLEVRCLLDQACSWRRGFLDRGRGVMVSITHVHAI